jgi:hypothetical protein
MNQTEINKLIKRKKILRDAIKYYETLKSDNPELISESIDDLTLQIGVIECLFIDKNVGWYADSTPVSSKPTYNQVVQSPPTFAQPAFVQPTVPTFAQPTPKRPAESFKPNYPPTFSSPLERKINSSSTPPVKSMGSPPKIRPRTLTASSCLEVIDANNRINEQALENIGKNDTDNDEETDLIEYNHQIGNDINDTKNRYNTDFSVPDDKKNWDEYSIHLRSRTSSYNEVTGEVKDQEIDIAKPINIAKEVDIVGDVKTSQDKWDKVNRKNNKFKDRLPPVNKHKYGNKKSPVNEYGEYVHYFEFSRVENGNWYTVNDIEEFSNINNYDDIMNKGIKFYSFIHKTDENLLVYRWNKHDYKTNIDKEYYLSDENGKKLYMFDENYNLVPGEYEGRPQIWSEKETGYAKKK